MKLYGSENNTTILHKGEDFQKGIMKSLKLTPKGYLALVENSKEGVFYSPEINTPGFKKLIASWNALTPINTSVELKIKVRKGNQWSEWFSYGKWGCNGKAKSVEVEQKDKIAHMSVDIIKLLNEGSADGLQYNISINRDDLSIESPQLKLIAVALELSNEEKSHSLINDDDWIRDLQVPVRSQMVIDNIGRIICSPTSLAMVMEYYGECMETEEVAEGVKDYGASIYGNWSFNVAFAGSLGFNAYVEIYNSINEVKRMIAKGFPLIASIKTKSIEELSGSHMPYPNGHLVVIRGFSIRDGIEYIIVNDPAAPNEVEVKREYPISDFINVWNKVVYYIEKENM
ncbi:C39 family peptidase [Alkaliphilus peptidifermentans]|uniref:Peptidase_C39 like family protein n=1 Tax=Alkaliphilus peptidifermentans DSM 18978 TaxID=1120976 RepID=A0A1G5BM12_9FIRM|nr:C39 family peptidase [Alkaliphilus peptidifermentans]SCX91198.1 Peptidase_C39 like family protein [Alkaliphilus peptidifermentans DSM 18978]